MVAVTGCGKHITTKPAALPNVSIADVPAPSSASVLVAHGDTLDAIAATAYGHERFSHFVGRFNHIASPEKLQAGTTLKTPSLAAAFQEFGVSPQYQPALNVLSKAWTDVTAITPAYNKARDASQVRDGGKFKLPEAVRSQLTASVGALDAAMEVLKHPAQGHKPPLTALLRLEAASEMLHMFAAGGVQSLDYDLFLMGQSFSLGFDHLLIWIESSYQSSK